MADIDDLYRLYIEERMSIPDVAKRVGMNYSATRKKMIEGGVPIRSRTDGIRAVSHKMGCHMRGKTRVFSDAWKKNIQKSASLRGERTARGISQKPSGYLEITRGENKGRSEHVIIMEARIGRRLRDDECVHHIDGIKTNNDENNLALVTRSGHTRLHRFEDRISGKIRKRN